MERRDRDFVCNEEDVDMVVLPEIARFRGCGWDSR